MARKFRSNITGAEWKVVQVETVYALQQESGGMILQIGESQLKKQFTEMSEVKDDGHKDA